jgi:hypothetical protein
MKAKKKLPKKLNNGGKAQKAANVATASAAGLTVLSSLIEDDAASNIVGSVGTMAGAGASVGSAFGPMGTAVGAGAGALVGLGSGLISENQKKKEEQKRKTRIANQAKQELEKIKHETTDVFSTDESIYNKAKVRNGYVEGLPGGDIKLYAEGGKVKGKGTAKSDSIPAKIPTGSIVVPAENANMAEALRASFLPKKEGKMKSGKTGVPVRVSNGEHMFTPKEKKKIDEALMAKGMNPNAVWSTMIPNPDPGNELSNGGAVSDTTMVKPAIQMALNPATKVMSDKDKKDAMDIMWKKRTSLPVSQQPILLAEGGKAEKKIYIPAGGKWGLKGGYDYPESVVLQAQKDWEAKQKQKNQDVGFIKNKIKEERQKAETELESVVKKYTDKYGNLGLSGPEVFGNPPKTLPTNVLESFRKEYLAARKKVEEGTKAENGYDELVKAGRPAVARQLAESHFKAIGAQVELPKKPEPKKSNVSNTEFSGDKYEQMLRNDPRFANLSDDQIKQAVANARAKFNEQKQSEIPTVTMPAPAAPTTGSRSKAGTSKAGASPSTASIQPIMAPENDDPAEQAPPEETPAGQQASAIQGALTGVTAGAEPAPEAEKKPKLSPIQIMSLAQITAGLMSANQERPLDTPSPVFINRVAASIGAAEKATNEAEYGFTYTQRQNIEKNLEKNRRQAMATTLQTTSGASGVSQALRALSQDKNSAAIEVEAKDAEVKTMKQNRADGVNQQADAMASALDQRKRQIFEDDSKAYWLGAEASGAMIDAGLSNLFNSIEQRKIDNEREKRNN